MQPRDASESSAGPTARALVGTLVLQVLITLLVAAAWAAFRNMNAGASALLGGAICIIPSAAFGWRLRSAARKGVGAVGVAFFVGELVKLGLSVLMFAAVLAWYPDADLVALVTAYILALQGYLPALLMAR